MAARVPSYVLQGGSDEGDIATETSELLVPEAADEADGDQITGTFTLTDSEGFFGTWNSCIGEGGFSDFGPGMNVTVRDGDGSVIGSWSTRSLTNADDEAETARSLDTWCIVAFEVELTDEADFYLINVGRRGEISFTRDELAAQNWRVELSLGD